MKAYHKFRQEQSGDGAPGGGGAPPGGGGQPGQPNVMGGAPPGDGFPKNPTPQEQQKILKDIFASMEGKDRNEQNEIINKFKPIQKEIFDKYNVSNRYCRDSFSFLAPPFFRLSLRIQCFIPYN